MEIFFDDKKKKKDTESQIKEAHEQREKKENEKNKFEGDNIAEAHENDMNEKLEDNEVRKDEKTYQMNIEYDMRAGKRELNMKVEDKSEMEKMRRWSIRIYNIYIIPLKDKMEPFVQFTIGGNFQVEVYKNKKGDTIKVPKGKRGFSDKTEIQDTVDKLEKRAFDKVIDVEMRMSYSMVSSQKMMVELWDYNTIWMNTIKSYCTVDILSIVDGNCNVTVDMLAKEPGKKRPMPYATVEFKCIFEEIWDFKMNFLNWKASSVISPLAAKNSNITKKKPPSTRVIVDLCTKDFTLKYKSTYSEVAKETE